MALKISKEILEEHKINIEVLDLRTISPLDKKAIIKTSHKTKKVIILDPSWQSFGSSAEILSTIYEGSKSEKILVKRLAYPDSHTPASSYLEKKFYLNEKKIKKTIINLFKKKK